MDSKCYYVVSGDKDLLTVKDYEGIEIVTVAEFLENQQFVKRRFNEEYTIKLYANVYTTIIQMSIYITFANSFTRSLPIE